MIDEQWKEIGRRAVACKCWRWLPGMLAIPTNNYHRPARIESLDGDAYGLTVVPGADGPVFAAHHEYGIAGAFPRGCTIPDFRDPSTLGCLLALVRDAWQEPLASVEVRQPGDLGCRACVRVPVGSEGWRVLQWWCASQDPQYSEAAALVAALEVAECPDQPGCDRFGHPKSEGHR